MGTPEPGAPLSSITANTPPGAARQSFGSFDIDVAITGTPTASQIQAFNDAEAFWESKITGFESSAIATQFATTAGGSLSISANLVAIDGPGNILGQAGSTAQILGGTPGTSSAHAISTAGIMNFDTDDLAFLEGQGTLGDVIIHEMGHVLGFSRGFWAFVGAIDPIPADTSTGDDSYTGAIALETYKLEFDPSATFIPVETAGGEGTAFSHWDEADFGDPLGILSDQNPELMTGFLEGPTYLSDTTLASLDDLGYVTIVTDQAFNAVVPLPAPALLLMSGIGALAMRRRLRA